MVDEQYKKLIFEAIDGTIGDADFHSLQDAIEQYDDVRAEYVRCLNMCETLGDIAAEQSNSSQTLVFESTPGPDPACLLRLNSTTKYNPLRQYKQYHLAVLQPATVAPGVLAH